VDKQMAVQKRDVEEVARTVGTALNRPILQAGIIAAFHLVAPVVFLGYAQQQSFPA
jgi:hypothetical protein